MDYVAEYKKMFEEVVIKSQEFIMSTLDLDAEGCEEYIKLIQDKDLTGEVLSNCHKMLLTDDEFKAYAELNVRVRDFINNKTMGDENGNEFIHRRCGEIYNKFYEDFDEDLSEIINKQSERDLLKYKKGV